MEKIKVQIGGIRMRKKIGLLFIVVLIAGILSACQSNQNEEQETVEKTEPTGIKPIVTMTMEDGGIVTMELYPDIAPNTVNNFISLIEDGFYDGLTFHRVIPGFMIQGGDPDDTGMGGPGYGIKGEFNSNGFENNLEHDAGVLSMARSQDHDSAGSQFFIMTEKSPHLDGDYAAFGKVTDGMDVVKKIVDSERDKTDKPLEDQIIQSMTVDLQGYKAKEPEKS